MIGMRQQVAHTVQDQMQLAMQGLRLQMEETFNNLLSRVTLDQSGNANGLPEGHRRGHQSRPETI